MFYGFAALLLLLSLATGIPAILRFRKMQKINKDCLSTFGVIRSTSQTLGWLIGAGLGRSNRLTAAFQSQDGKEILFDVTDNNGFLSRGYEIGDTVDIVYNKHDPWKAYVKREWQIAKIDLWKSGIELILAIILWIMGINLGMPL